MDVNFNGSLWWCNILQLYRGKKCSAQIFAKGSHSIAYFVRLILSPGQGFSHNWHRHCQIWSACQIQCRPRAWDTDCELKYHFLGKLSRQKVSYITWNVPYKMA